MTGFCSAYRIGFNVRLLGALSLSLFLSATATAQPISCADLNAAERQNEQSWLKLEMDYPILLPILSDCFKKNILFSQKEQAIYTIACAVAPCAIAQKLSGEDVCSPLASQVVQYHFRKDTIKQRRLTLSCT